MSKEYGHIGSREDRAIEEMGEVLQAIGKCNRFGKFSYHPDRVGTTNIDELILELTDTIEVLGEYKQELLVFKAKRRT